MSRFYNIAKSNYDKGLWNKAMLETLVALERITEEEYKEITGEDE